MTSSIRMPPFPGLASPLMRHGVALFALATGLLACAEEDRATSPVVRDSAGVTIVESVDVDGPPRWTAGPEPLLAIGSDEGEGGFGLVSGLAMLEDGTIAVADAIDQRVRFFDQAGVEVAAAGRRGEGPGEFEALDRMWVVGEDEVAVWDRRFGRYTSIKSDGQTGETVQLEATAERAEHSPIGFLSDGRLLAESDARQMPPLETYRTPVTVLTFATAGTVGDTIVTVPGLDMWNWVWEMGTSPTHIPFGRTTTIGLFNDGVWVGANEGYRLDRYDLQGNLTLQIRLDRAAAPLDADRIDAYKGEEHARAESSEPSKGGNDLFGRMADDAPYPGSLPFYEGFVVDEAGRLWVRDVQHEGGGPAQLTVFAPNGQLLGRAELPSGFRPTQIRTGRVIGIWLDAFDLEHVRIYELEEH